MDKVKYFIIPFSEVSSIPKVHCNDLRENSVPFILETFCLGNYTKY